MGLVEAIVRLGGIFARRMVFRANATDEPGHKSSAGDVVEHGELFGDGKRIVQQRQSAAKHGNLRALGPPRQGTGHDPRNGHEPVSILVMLVDTNTVKAQFVRKFEFVEIAVVQQMPLRGIVIGIR